MIAQPDQLVNARILLASASPRRRELITLLGLPVESIAVKIDESPRDGEAASDLAIRLSREKAQAAALFFIPHPSSFIIAADTIVSLDGQPLGKPRDATEATSMLRQLRGRSHQVFTAVTLIDTATGRTVTDLTSTDVPMRDYSDAEIEAYVASGDPFDKAGAYAIQHNGFHPVERLSGCFANVMGLPLCHITRSLHVLGIEPPADVPAACQAHIRYECPVFRSILSEMGCVRDT